MKLTLLAIVLTAHVAGYSQIIDELPTDEAGKILFTGFTKLTKQNSKTIYKRLLKFFPPDANDKTLTVVTGTYQNVIEIGDQKLGITCTLKLISSDSGFHYNINEIKFRYPVSSPPTQAEDWFDQKTYYEAGYNPKVLNEQLKDELISWISLLTYSIGLEVLKLSD